MSGKSSLQVKIFQTFLSFHVCLSNTPCFKSKRFINLSRVISGKIGLENYGINENDYTRVRIVIPPLSYRSRIGLFSHVENIISTL